MRIFALSDPHLAFGVPSKDMALLSPDWKDYAMRIERHWKESVSKEDLVLIPGDISWATRPEEALIDLNWIDQLPGKKVLLKGNHDYWWPSSQKLKKLLPPSIDFIYNSALAFDQYALGGARLWDTEEYSFNSFIEYRTNPFAREKGDPTEKLKQDRAIFERELERLRISLSQLSKSAKIRIAMTHYPPVGADLKPSRASALLEEFKIDICVFGHLHSVRKGSLPFEGERGEARGVRYLFTSCDYLEFKPLQVL